MRGPEIKGRRAKKAGAARPVRPRIMGGKVVARILYFQQQREVGGAEDRSSAAKRKAEQSYPLLASFEHKRSLEAAAPAQPTRQAWRPLGPLSIPHGQTYGHGRGSRPSVYGRVSAVAVDPGNARHILVGAAGGGVWESKDAGKTWSPRTDNQPSLAIGAVTFNPVNPLIVYAGTGEGDTTLLGYPNLLGAGLLRSNDGGTNWSVQATSVFEKVGFYNIVVDPLNGNHLLAATTEGVFESTDGGTGWTKRRSSRTWALSMRLKVSGVPDSTKEVFAACSDGVFRSTNGGASWSAVTLPGASGDFDRIAVCHAPSDGNIVYVFAAECDPANPYTPTPLLWRRNIFGGGFVPITLPLPRLETGQAWYDWFAAVAPNDPDVIYLGTIHVYKVRRLPGGSWSWTNISNKTDGDSIHPDQHAIAFSPTDPNVVYVGNDGGIYRSPDGGVSWRSLNKGLCIAQVEFMAQHPQFESWLLVGTQDNGTLRYQGEETWHHVADDDGGDCGVNASSPYACYYTCYGMGVGRSTKGGGWGTWTHARDSASGPPVFPSEDYPGGALFYPPVEVNGRLVVQAGISVFISNDGGVNWVRVPLLLKSSDMASALAVPTPGRIYVGTSQGRVFRLDFAAGQWSAPVRLTRPATGFISDILVDPTNANRIYVTFHSSSTGINVFRSDNAGASWNAANSRLPPIAMNAIEIDPARPDTIFVAADVGVYRSLDAGVTWDSFSNGLPNALAKDLLFHTQSRLLRVGTQSRGVWEIAVDEAMIPDVEIYLRDNVVDTGRRSPSPSDVDDPFHFGSRAHWFQCRDVKVDSPLFQTAAASDVDFEVFGDDESLIDKGIQFAAGLKHEDPQRGKTVRVFVQVHNRGVNAATNVVVKVFFTASSLTPPKLPKKFWANFPNNVVPQGSAWQPIAPHRGIQSVGPGKSEIVAFDWPVPLTASNSTSLLAIISAHDDTLTTTERDVLSLVRDNKKCGLKNVTVVNPPPTAGPKVTAVHLDVRKSDGFETFSIEADRPAASLVRAVVLSKGLSRRAKKAGVSRVELSDEDRGELNRLIQLTPSLKQKLDVKSAYAIQTGPWLRSIKLSGNEPESVVLIIEPKPRRGQGSIVQKAEDGTILGGYTLEAV